LIIPPRHVVFRMEIEEFLRDRLTREMSRLPLKFRLVLLSIGVGIVAVPFPGDRRSTRLEGAPGRHVGEEHGAVASNASRRDGTVARAQPFKRGGLP